MIPLQLRACVQGSGYLTACFGLLVQPAGFAVGIERNEGLTEMSKTNLQKSVPELMEGNTAIVIRSGNILGCAAPPPARAAATCALRQASDPRSLGIAETFLVRHRFRCAASREHRRFARIHCYALLDHGASRIHRCGIAEARDAKRYACSATI